jgi:hypothetical protein
LDASLRESNGERKSNATAADDNNMLQGVPRGPPPC